MPGGPRVCDPSCANWRHLDKFDPIWMNLSHFGQVWSNLGHYRVRGGSQGVLPCVSGGLGALGSGLTCLIAIVDVLAKDKDWHGSRVQTYSKGSGLTYL